MTLKDLTKIKDGCTWEFIYENEFYTWIVKNNSEEIVGECYEKYENLEDCILNASINGYSKNKIDMEDSWVFYYRENKGYKWQRFNNEEGDIISQSICYFKNRKECIENASIFGF